MDGSIYADMIALLLKGQGMNSTVLESTNANKRALEELKTVQPRIGKIAEPKLGNKLDPFTVKPVKPEKLDTSSFKWINDLSSIIPKYGSKNNTVNTSNTLYDTGADMISNIDPAIGAAFKASGAAYDFLNTATNGAFSVNNKSTGTVSTIDNILGSKIGYALGWGHINSMSKISVEGSDDSLTNKITSGYLPSNKIEDTEFGGISRLLSKKKIEQWKENVQRTNTENILKGSAVSKAERDKYVASNNLPNIIRKNNDQLLNTNYSKLLSARKGIKLFQLKNIINKAKSGIKFNVIPSGALHARKNNIGKFGDNITHKGIPVVSGEILEHGGEITQHAEIEKNEIIFHKELTNKIEELYKEYKDSKDSKILLKVGKLLTYEILENTNDNTNLIETVDG